MTGLPALFGALGTVLVAFGLLNFLLAASRLEFGFGVDFYWIAGQVVVGLLLLVGGAVLGSDALRERLHSGEARRAGKYGSSAILTTLLGIAILGGLGWLANQYPQRFDWSEGSIHSLSDQSRQVVQGLSEDVEVLALYRKPEQEAIRELLERYSYESERFRVEYVDPVERPDVLARYGVTEEQLGETGVLRVGLGDESTLVQEVTEENITNAMVKLTRSGAKKIYFLEGHNERAIEGDAADSRQGYGRAADALRNENYEVAKLLLAAEGEVPADANAVIVAGATRPLLGQEREALRRYVARGGALLALVDPRARTDLVEDLREWGVDVGDDVIVDRRLALFGSATTPFAAQYDTGHEITRDMREATLFPIVRSVRNAEDGDFTEIVFTGDSSWAERDLELFYAEGRAALDETDLRGPVPVAVAGTPRVSQNGSGPEADDGAGADGGEGDEGESVASGNAGDARLVVFGDADFPSNEYIEAMRNRDLFLNTVNWLIGDIEAISIRPAISRASSLRQDFSRDQFLRLRSLSLFVLPEAIAIIGVLVWWSRRWAPGR